MDNISSSKTLVKARCINSFFKIYLIEVSAMLVIMISIFVEVAVQHGLSGLPLFTGVFVIVGLTFAVGSYLTLLRPVLLTDNELELPLYLRRRTVPALEVAG